MQAFVSECDWYDRLSHCMQGSNPFLEKVPGLHDTAVKLQIYSLAFISMQRTPFKADKNRFVGVPLPITFIIIGNQLPQHRTSSS